ncbi:M48 family metallopeptidase [Acinetobacter gerneri]|uniref:M48 family metallopeptidase n=1 Tax=Acinetobacter gerneri TaxID=202952 RepID=UPI003214EEB3
MSDQIALPEIKLVRHARATRLRLRVEPTQIRLTAPIYCTQKQIEKFINESHEWLVETWTKQQAQYSAKNQELPQDLQLFNLEQPLNVIYQTQKQSFIFDESNLQLYISNRHPEAYLKAFVITYAKNHLVQFLETTSHEIGLNYKQCAVRQPKTRWGSCTQKHDIMLNSGLVLFSKEIVRYVCVHELAHTKHFDHSTKFWNLVQSFDSNYLMHRKLLKTTAMPYWWF